MKVKGLRWWVIVLIFLAAVLNYVNRQTLSALPPTIQHDLGMDDRDYANIVNIFLIAYTFAYLVSGKIVDLLGTRVGMVIFVLGGAVWAFADYRSLYKNTPPSGYREWVLARAGTTGFVRSREETVSLREG